MEEITKAELIAAMQSLADQLHGISRTLMLNVIEQWQQMTEEEFEKLIVD